VNRKEALNDVTAYKMVRMMQGTVDIGTAAGLRNRLGAAEMGGKTGTTNDNSDAWFMGYSPQLLAGVWVGCDDRFIRLNKNDTRGYGGTAARPIWEAFYKKVYADKKLGIDREARFSKPDNLELEMNSADPLNLLDSIPPPAAEGEDQKVNESDFEIMKSREYIGPESKPITDDDKDKKSKKDTASTQAVKIGEPQPEEKKKKGIFNKIFGKKEKKDN
jgi:penicillin-binding protein 1A